MLFSTPVDYRVTNYGSKSRFQLNDKQGEAILRAFLSHSSLDKAFVRQVASDLGDGQCELDENSFDYIMNTQAIRDGLSRSELFVYFLSKSSISASFVDYEQKLAMEKQGSGLIKRTIVFALDDTSYRALPEWLREINIVQKLSSPKACARKIQAALIKLDAEEGNGDDIYLGRNIEDALLTKVLSGSPSKTPLAIHAVGHYGVGRKTFLKRNLNTLFPRRFGTFLEVTVASNQGIEELYRQIYDLNGGGSLEDTLRDLTEFPKRSALEQAQTVAYMIDSLAKAGEFLLITDDGGIYTEEGDYQDYIKHIVERVNGNGLPVVGFIQTRMMPTKFKERNVRSFHQYIPALSDETTRQVFGLLLKQLRVDYTDEEISRVGELLDGHPFNVRFAARYSYDYGLDVLLSDPTELIEWKRKRAEDFLVGMTFSDIEADIIAALSEYRHLATETLFSVLNHPMGSTASALRRLLEFSCVERREGYCHIAPPIRDAVRRDKRFFKSDEWKQALGQGICDALSDYQNEDNVSIAILDGGALAAARGLSAPPFLSSLILPSHLLRIARDHYDANRRALCIEFCERAWLSKDRLPNEAQLELLRIWGLSAVRINDNQTYEKVLKLFQAYRGRLADRQSLFVEGFYYRVSKRPDEAERKFLSAWRLAKNNQSINRELASLLAKQRRYEEAEVFARGAYVQAPTNPFLLDVMAEVLLGKFHLGLPVDQQELHSIMQDLARYGDAPGSSFYLIRTGQSRLARGEYREALDIINRAVTQTPDLVSPRFLRAEIKIALHDLAGAESDLQNVRILLTNSGGHSEGDEARLIELEIKILIEKRLYRLSKERIENSYGLSRKVKTRLTDLVVLAISYEQGHIDHDIKAWALQRSSNKRG